MNTRGLTLLEIVAVVVIIAIVMAIVFPALASARHKAHETVCLSNLRQCGDALLLYDGDWGDMPVGQAAVDTLMKAPTCDPEDSWRSSCNAPYWAPRVGSYGYVRLCPDYADQDTWQTLMNSDEPLSLVISIDYGARPVVPFQGMIPALPACIAGLKCVMPDRIPSFEYDGSAKARRKGTATINVNSGHYSFEVFTWPTAFTKRQDVSH